MSKAAFPKTDRLREMREANSCRLQIVEACEPDLTRLPSGYCDANVSAWTVAALKELKRLRSTDAAKEMGARGGQAKSLAKQIASRANGRKGGRGVKCPVDLPHVEKVDYFLSIYPHLLKANEWGETIPLTIGDRNTSYNPDYFCEVTQTFIEITTSVPNISEQGAKWREAIAGGMKLKVYWWEGKDITPKFTPASVAARKTEVPQALGG